MLPALSRVRPDALLAAGLLTLGESQVWLGWSAGGVGTAPDDDRLARALLVVACTVPLAWRRRRPLAVVAAVSAAVVVQVTLVVAYVPFLPALLPLLVADYSAAAYALCWRPAALAAVLATEAVLFARIPQERVAGEVLFALFVAVGSWTAGDVVRARLSRAERAVGAARAELAELEEAAARARTEERARIARELHDVIAHGVSLMGIQAGAARTLLDTDPGAAREALRTVESVARDSVADLQRLLALLRDPEASADGRDPQPGLADVPRLVEQVRAAGLPVELALSGAPALPPGADLAAYRIVQEALTNAVKHAQAPTTVSVRCAEDAVHLEVRDAGGSVPAPRNAGGHGLVGMHDRAALYGGSVEAGRCPGGGFLVRARLPVRGGPA